MKKVLFIVILLLSNLQAIEIVLCQENNYIFTQKNFNELVEFAEYLARHKLTQDDIEDLKTWAIDDFKASAKPSAVFYKRLSKDVVSYFYKKETRASYSTELYRDIVIMFQKYPEYS